MIRLLLSFFLVFCMATAVYSQADTSATKILIEPEQPDLPAVVIPGDYRILAEENQLVIEAEGLEGRGLININEAEAETALIFANGRARLPVTPDIQGQLLLLKGGDKKTGGEHYRLYHLSVNKDSSLRLRKIPLWLSIIPPLVAIVLALIFREVVVSLFIGVWTGAFIAGGMRIDSLYYFVISILQVVQIFIVNALNDTGHLSVIIFSLLIGGMVAIISRNGGMAGVVQSLSRYAKSPTSSQFITWFLGVAIFFDDYANTLIVGNTMRPVTDKFRVSREKLAYIVDSTAAPVAAVAFITTWIGAELGYIGDATRGLEGFETGATPYAIFLDSIKYSFYPILTLAFILMLIYFKKDFGPMLRAERRARSTGEVSKRTADEVENAELENLDPVKGAPLNWYNAVVPVAVVILMTLFGLLDTGLGSVYAELVGVGAAPASSGWGDTWAAMAVLFPGDNPGFFLKLGKAIGAADSYVALLWASVSGVLVAIVMTLSARIMRLPETINTMITGFKTMLPALIILTLAWSLASTTDALHTATYLTSALQDSINPYLMPAIIFVLASLISFSTGSSWSTMAILYPIAIPTIWAICQAQNLEPDISMEITLNVIATVLAASVLGDHCSPISDTTILSSLASDCNHIDHVRTQLPYAITVGVVSLLAGVVSTLLGGGWAICLLMLAISLGVLALIVWRLGGKVEE